MYVTSALELVPAFLDFNLLNGALQEAYTSRVVYKGGIPIPRCLLNCERTDLVEDVEIGVSKLKIVGLIPRFSSGFLVRASNSQSEKAFIHDLL